MDVLAQPEQRAFQALLVEDDPADAYYVADCLAESGLPIEVVLAECVAEAEARLANLRFDAVIIDLGLPDSSGFDTLERIRRAANDVPLIVLSGSVDDDMRREARRRGADEVFSKDEHRTSLFSRSIHYVIQRDLANREHRALDRILSSTPDGIVVVRETGVVAYVNPAALRLFGRKRRDFVGELVGFSVGDGITTEINLVGAGRQRQCELRVVAIEWEREPAYLATLRDITEQKRMEAQLAISDRMVSIGTLAAGVAHEINNPLTAVIANLSLAQKKLSRLSSPDLLPAAELRDADEAARRIRSIVRDLKVLSRSEDEVRVAMDVHEVIESSLRMARTEIHHRARIVRDYGNPPRISANEAKVGQVLLNLLINAAHAIPEGHAEDNAIGVKTEVSEEGWAKISVSDTGSGIPKGARDRLFTAFFTTKAAGEGTGLGLAICQRIVHSFDGEIGFETELGKGTTFWVQFPPADNTDSIRPPSMVPQAGGRRARVMVLDDDEIVGLSIARTLEEEHEVCYFRQATDALEALSKDANFDVILCDLMMPQMSGMDVHQRLAQQGHGLERRMVFITGGAFTRQAREFLERVPNARLEKPFDPAQLGKLIHEMTA